MFSFSRLLKLSLSVIALSLSLAKTGSAQENADSAFHARATVVLVPVCALDKHGELIPGLTIKDFELRVDGKSVTIVSLDSVTDSATTSAGRPAAMLPPGTYINVPSSTVPSPNLLILIIDFLNTSQAERMWFRSEALKYFSAGLRPSQQIGVYGLGYSLVMLLPFTDRPEPLIEVAKNLLHHKGLPPGPAPGTPPGNAGTLSPLIPPPASEIGGGLGVARGGSQGPSENGNQDPSTDALIDFLSTKSMRQAYNLNQMDRAARTLEQFRQLADAFAGVPGKKTVVWLTGDPSPLNPTMMNRILLDQATAETLATPWWEIAKTYEALNSAGISLFPVDLRGVVNTGLLGADQEESHQGFRQAIMGSQPTDGSPYSNMASQRQGEAANAVQAMQTAAEETGGVVLQGTNEIAKLMDRAEKYWRSYYVLSFVPETPDTNAKPAYHRIEVKVDRPVTRLLARRGFVSRPAAMVSSMQEVRRDMTEASQSPVDLTALRLVLSLGEIKNAEKAARLPFTLKIQGDGLAAVHDSRGSRFDLSVVVVMRDREGKIVNNHGENLSLAIPPTQVEAVKKEGLTYKGEFQVPAGNVYFGRVMVRDNHTGEVGTLTLLMPRS